MEEGVEFHSANNSIR